MYGKLTGRTGDSQHLVYLLGSAKQKKKKKKNRVWSQEVVSITHLLRPLYQLKCSPCPLVPWSSVNILPYQCELVKKTEPQHRRGNSMQGISYGDDKRGRKKQKGKNSGV